MPEFEHLRAGAAKRLPDHPAAKDEKTFFTIKELRIQRLFSTPSGVSSFDRSQPRPCPDGLHGHRIDGHRAVQEWTDLQAYGRRICDCSEIRYGDNSAFSPTASAPSPVRSRSPAESGV